MESKTVEKDSCPVELTAKEYDLFLLFLRNRNIALYRERIYEEVWGGEFHPDCLKREKLGLIGFMTQRRHLIRQETGVAFECD